MKFLGLFIFALLPLLAGCSKPTAQQIDATIDVTGPVLIQGALKHFAVKSPDATKQAATLLSQACDDSTALISNNTLPAAQFIPLLESTLLKKIPGDYESVTVGALALLVQNINLNAPALSDVEKQHCLHTVAAIKKGCTLFLNGKVAMLYGVPKPEIAIETNAKAEVIELPAPKVVSAPIIRHVDSSAQKPCVAARVHHHDDYPEPEAQGQYYAHEEVVPAETVVVEGPPQTIAQPVPDTDVEVNGTRKINSDGYVLVEFSATWCGACRKNAPNMDALESDKGGFAEVHCIDVDANQEIATERNVDRIPCQIVYHNGQEVARHTGVHSRDEMVSWIAEANAR